MKNPVEYRVVAIRECPLPEDLQLCDVPAKALEYWQLHVKTDPNYGPERESLVVLMLNARRRVKGHQFLTHGTIDTILVRIGDVYRAAIIAAAASIIAMHTHPRRHRALPKKDSPMLELAAVTVGVVKRHPGCVAFHGGPPRRAFGPGSALRPANHGNRTRPAFGDTIRHRNEPHLISTH